VVREKKQKMKLKSRPLFIVFLCILLGLVILPQPASAQAPVPVVQAVLFYSPNCGHCIYVINEILPTIFEQYGPQLQMLGIDVTQPDGHALFVSTLQMFSLEQAGIPFLVVGNTYLSGDVDIPVYFPGLIDSHLATGGVGWPDIPGLADFIASVESTQEARTSPSPEPPTALPATSVPVAGTLTPVLSTPTPDPIPTATPAALILTSDLDVGLADRLAQDSIGNGLAILVLLGMVASVGRGIWYFCQPATQRGTGNVLWIIPILCILGLGVAGYLAYVETTNTEAVCGPVGDCNTVQQSEYARLFGILPIGVLGMLGYVVILAAWFTSLKSKGSLADYGTLAMLAMTVIGTIFSVYLTFLEPFVIGATCAWCLTSAGIMTALFLFSLEPGKQAFYSLLARSTFRKRRASRK
jgi:uncharacterized membrane protein